MHRTLFLCSFFLSGAMAVSASHAPPPRAGLGPSGLAPHGPYSLLLEQVDNVDLQGGSYVVGAVQSTDFPTVRAGVPPNDPSNLAVASATSQRIRLTWDDNASDEDDYRVERKEGTVGAFVEVARLPENTTTYSDSTVAGQVAYTYQVLACASFGGCSDPSNEVSVTTPALAVFIGDPEAADPRRIKH